MQATSAPVTFLKYAANDYDAFTTDDGRKFEAGTSHKITIDEGERMATYKATPEAAAKAAKLEAATTVRLVLDVSARFGAKVLDLGS